MKSRRFTQLVLVAVSSAFLVSAGYAQPYSELYVFGESLVDMGNAKDLFWSYSIDFPPSPPYAGGDFAMGRSFRK